MGILGKLEAAMKEVEKDAPHNGYWEYVKIPDRNKR